MYNFNKTENSILNLNSYTYDYWLKLVDAIESYTSNKISMNNEYFYYNGVNFVAAFERMIYFEIMSNVNYVKEIKYAILNNSIVLVHNPTHKDILSGCYPSLNIKFKVKVIPNLILKNIVLSNKFLTKQYLKYSNTKISYDDYKTVRYVFVIIHHKFIHYMAPIYKELKDALFIICGDKDKSLKICNINNYKYEILNNITKVNGQTNKDMSDLIAIYENVKLFVSHSNPKCIIIPEGNAPVYELFNLVSKKNNKIKTICIQQGWSPVYHNGFRKMHYDIFLTWGEEFSNLLQKYNPDQKFKAVGNHILKLNQTKKVKSSIAFFHQGINFIITQKDSDLFFKLAITLATKYKKIKIIIREHPSNPIDSTTKNELLQHNNIIFMNPDKYTLSEVLAVSKIAISVYSTVLYEAMVFDVIPLSFNTTSLPSLDPSLDKLNLGIEEKKIDKTINEIDTLLENKNNFNKILKNIEKDKKKYFKTYDNQAIQNIIKEIN